MLMNYSTHNIYIYVYISIYLNTCISIDLHVYIYMCQYKYFHNDNICIFGCLTFLVPCPLDGMVPTHTYTGSTSASRTRNCSTTVDGRTPAPADMVNVSLFTEFCTSQVVQDFFHQQLYYQ